MLKKLTAAAVSGMLLLGTSACSPVRLTEDAPPSCETDERYLQVEVDAYRWPQAGGPGSDRIDPLYDVDIAFAAVSTVENFGGVDLDGIGVVGAQNHDIVERVTPFSEAACWPEEYPVAFLVRAWKDNPTLDDELHCTLTDKHDTKGFVGNVAKQDDAISFEDMVGGPRSLYVECIDYYLPPGWSGPDLPRFPPPSR